ncbi:serine/threonine protein kinase [uncultured Deefgea sp.]|uniref:serine/threonine protein kinase n=1 Tax=uncultured Deefgea sp. TaxID=1304914 RepID=UPI002620B96B|nr:serine/threonine protein kinase [uncultured Deefgea sp.]
MPSMKPAPYSALTPDLTLDALESLGLACSGHLLALNSYENRVYQVGIDDGDPVIAKFYRPERWSDAAILEEHEFTQALAEREIPVVAPLTLNGQTLHRFGDFRFAVFPRRGGRAPELDQAETREWIGRFLGRIHAVGQLSPFAHRAQLTPQTFGQDSLDYLINNNVIPLDLAASYQATAEAALAGVAECYQRAGDIQLIRLHGDCHPSNILWTPAGPHFVDFDDARTGPAIQDLWMLLSGDREEQQNQLADILAGYEDFCEFDRRELHLIEALRTIRLMHYSAWLARRWDDPAFPAAFPWFNTATYWQDRIAELREQIEIMHLPPLWSNESTGYIRIDDEIDPPYWDM